MTALTPVRRLVAAIVDLRESLALDRAALAERSGVDVERIEAIETGATPTEVEVWQLVGGLVDNDGVALVTLFQLLISEAK